jgi:UDP-3-O-[3-hydroxymyristoyl] glucosamine N-acyltransferase
MANEIYVIGFSLTTITDSIISIFRSSNYNIQILCPKDFLNDKFNTNNKFIVTVTEDLDLRQQIVNKIDQDCLERANLIHHTCVINTSQIGEGTIIGPFSLALTGAVIGKDCIIGPYSLISHNVAIGDGCILNSGVMIANNSKVGKKCEFNIRSTVLDHLTICDNIKVAAASTITKNIDQSGYYVGTPARKCS